MIISTIQKNIFVQYLEWHLFDVPKNILKGWRNFLAFNLNYFSIPLLFKTLFSPWRRYTWAYPRGFDLGGYLEVFFSNLISRTLGAIVRIFFIFLGAAVEIIILLIGLVLFLGWFFLPFLLIGSLVLAIKMMI